MTMRNATSTCGMQQRMVEFCARKNPDSPSAVILRLIRDPLRPAGDGGFKTSPVILWTCIVAGLTFGLFLFFSFGV